MAIHFKLVSEFQTIHRRPFELADSTILNPVSTNPLIDGEWLELTSGYKMARGSVNPAVVPSYAYFAEQGRYEVQAIKKGPVLYLGWFEADTTVMLSTGIVMGSALEVANVDIGGVNKRGLVLRTTGFPVGYATRLPADNGGYLRFVRGL
jgi:hypothetical protein